MKRATRIVKALLPAPCFGGLVCIVSNLQFRRGRYGDSLLKVLGWQSIRRLFNSIAAEWCEQQQTVRVFNKPTNAIFELTNHCNLRCPLCNTGGLRDQFSSVDRGMMSFSTFKAGIDRLLPELQSIMLYSWGEPLYNKDLNRCIAYARRHGILTQISSNMMVCGEEKSRGLIEAGLSKIIVSCDGLTQESYEKYRVRGNLAKVTRNALRLIELKRELGVEYPEVTLQFIVFKHNEDEMAEFEKIWMERGADRVDFIRMSYMSQEGEDVARELDLVPRNSTFRPYHPYGSLKRCSDPYHHVTINWNGDWYTCCFPPGELEYRFGNIVDDNFWGVWNGPRYRYSRELIKRQRVGNNPVDTMCHDCTGVFPNDSTRRYWKIRRGDVEESGPDAPAGPNRDAGAEI